jgi:hypothetical protein
MKFTDTAVNREQRFSIGQEIESGNYYLSIPVSNRLCDYEEHYSISQSMHDAYPGNLPELVEFANQCRQRCNDQLLFLKPGSDRGIG